MWHRADLCLETSPKETCGTEQTRVLRPVLCGIEQTCALRPALKRLVAESKPSSDCSQYLKSRLPPILILIAEDRVQKPEVLRRGKFLAPN
ncbi:hypothetical protein PoB_006825400 [Plakobranchus ocellatus]|uniref:Uncharacterized protein n=1 Tax=Plakobranchus ocellatus TaxID=259542 RepID=A0AAV4DC18_9GAST|nr:hypothetical protein PoB_006825400 [Plakobranchus ocellatus]